MLDGSGVSREAPAPFWERLEVKSLWPTHHVIREARKAGAKVGLCGQAPSDHPEFAEFLVACGIDSLSVTPDSFLALKRHVAAAEKRT